MSATIFPCSFSNKLIPNSSYFESFCDFWKHFTSIGVLIILEDFRRRLRCFSWFCKSYFLWFGRMKFENTWSCSFEYVYEFTHAMCMASTQVWRMRWRSDYFWIILAGFCSRFTWRQHLLYWISCVVLHICNELIKLAYIRVLLKFMQRNHEKGWPPTSRKYTDVRIKTSVVLRTI